MRKFANSCLAACLLTSAACSSSSGKVASASPVYQGVPAALMARCTVQDVPQETVAAVIESRGRYIQAFKKCAAKVDAIRKFDAEARGK